MKTALTIVKTLKKKDIEPAIHEYSLLCDQMEALEAKRLRLRHALIQAYFNDHTEYLDDNGVVLASYKTILRQHFDSIRFRIDHPDLFKSYDHKQKVKVFRVK